MSHIVFSFLRNFFYDDDAPPSPSVAHKGSAGVFFTDGNLYLAGYQPKKKNPCISGIGGHMEEGESEVQAALREMVEELFEIYPVPQNLQNDLKIYLNPQTKMCNQGYTILQYSFHDLETMLVLMKQYDMKSKLYVEFPITIADLVFKRLISTDSEISHLAILPFIEQPPTVALVSSYLLSDIKQLKKINHRSDG